MTLRQYRPISVTLKISKSESDQTEFTFNKLWNSAKPEPHHCLRLGDFTLIKSDIIQSKSLISVKNPDELQRQKVVSSYPNHLQSEIKALEKKHNLTKTHLKKLKKEIEAEEARHLEVADQIKLLNERGFELRTESNNKNFIKRFRKRYSSFNECLDNGLKDLDSSMKNEINSLLDDLNSRIKEVKPFLERL